MVSKSFQRFLLLFLPLLVTFSSSSAQFLTECPPETANYTSGSGFETNLKGLIDSLVTKAPRNNGFFSTAVGENSDEAYGLAQCRGDISTANCSSCLDTSRSGIAQICPSKSEAAIIYDYCLLRYSNQNFFSTVYARIYAYLTNTGNVSDPIQFTRVLGGLLKDLSDQAAFEKSNMFATGESRTGLSDFQNVYGLVQCNRDLWSEDCRNCLENVISRFSDCCGGQQGGWIVFVTCSIRYDVYPFFQSLQMAPSPVTENSENSTATPTGSSSQEIKNLLVVIRIYEIMLGQRVNLHKSLVFGIKVPPSVTARVAAILHCSVGQLPSTYLGLPLRVGKPRKVDWLDIIARTECKLNSWRGRFLSLPGRITLIKASLSAIPTYFLSCFEVPVWVAKRLEQIQRNFLWHGPSGLRKIHLIGWATVCSPISEGGLGLRRIRDVNRALLAKWVWRFGLESHALWRKIIVQKYGLSHSGWQSGPAGLRGFGFWKSICKIQDEVWNHISFTIGDGSRVLFWKDLWCGDVPLCGLFPRLFRAAADPNAFVADQFSVDAGAVLWNPRFRRPLREFELPDLLLLRDLLSNSGSPTGGSDHLKWALDSSGAFSVKTCYLSFISPASAPDPLAAIWRLAGPPRPKACLWLIGKDRILTKDALGRRAFVIPMECIFCNLAVESARHLFLQCPWSAEIWQLLSSYLGCSIDTDRPLIDFIIQWITASLQGRARRIWHYSILATCSAIWRARNAVVFYQVCSDPRQVADGFRRTIANWAIASRTFVGCSPVDVWKDGAPFMLGR